MSSLRNLRSGAADSHASTMRCGIHRRTCPAPVFPVTEGLVHRCISRRPFEHWFRYPVLHTPAMKILPSRSAGKAKELLTHRAVDGPDAAMVVFTEASARSAASSIPAPGRALAASTSRRKTLPQGKRVTSNHGIHGFTDSGFAFRAAHADSSSAIDERKCENTTRISRINTIPTNSS